MRRRFFPSGNAKKLNKLSPLQKNKEDQLPVFKYVKDCYRVKGSNQSALHVPARLVRSNELKLQDISSVLALDYFLMAVKMKNCCSLPKKRTKPPSLDSVKNRQHISIRHTIISSSAQGKVMG